MLSTHMEYGFISVFLLALLIGVPIPSVGLEGIMAFSSILVLLGFFGGLIPDVDRLESIGFSHRKTLHYPLGYGLLVLLLIGLGFFVGFSVWIVGVSCVFLGAWLHSVMDIFDGFYEHPDHGVYEHITRSWIKALNWIPFASLWEWSLQSIGAVVFIIVAPFVSELFTISGWIITATIYFIVWVLSTVWEFRKTVPKRKAMEKRVMQSLRN